MHFFVFSSKGTVENQTTIKTTRIIPQPAIFTWPTRSTSSNNTTIKTKGVSPGKLADTILATATADAPSTTTPTVTSTGLQQQSWSTQLSKKLGQASEAQVSKKSTTNTRNRAQTHTPSFPRNVSRNFFLPFLLHCPLCRSLFILISSGCARNLQTHRDTVRNRATSARNTFN